MRGKCLIVLVVMLLLLPTVYATLQITAFSCKGESGTITTENGETFSCTATVNNPDSQNSATLNSVILYVDGNWLENQNYAGSGFSTTISATASTTATFTDITSVGSGLNSFDYISLDGVTDTYIVDTTVNVIDITALSSSAPASVSQGGEFTISGSVTAGGSMSVTMNISLSGGCSLVTGETASKSVGSMSHNTQASKSWSVAMGGSECSYTITVVGTQGIVSATETTTGSIARADGSSGASSSSSSSDTISLSSADITAGSVEELEGLGKGEKVTFIHAGSHSLTVEKVYHNSVKIVIKSTPKEYYLNVGETINVDLNGDGFNDLKVKLVDIRYSRAYFELEFLFPEEDVVVAEEKEEPMIVVDDKVIEEPSGAVVAPIKTIDESVIEEPVVRNTAGVVAILVVIVFIGLCGYCFYRKKK